MNVNRRTQAERSAATREALIAAARLLFAQQGFGAVSTEAIVEAAGVTRGALYHQFENKTELFAAVFEVVEEDVTGRIDVIVSESDASDPIDLMVLGSKAWLDSSSEPEVQQIVLLDAPSALGWERWREVGHRFGIGLVESLLMYGISEGRIPEQPVRPLAHILIGALEEAVLYIARADDQDLARGEVGAVLENLVVSLAKS